MARRSVLGITLLISATLLVLVGTSATAHDEGRGQFKARLSGFQETPSVSTSGSGSLSARIDLDAGTITYTLTYSGLESTASVAHIHFGQRGVAGGVIAFLCGGGDKPTCPATSGSVTGTIDAADIIGPATQGIAPGEFAEVVRAIRAGAVYANVHTATFPNGEIRGQVGRGEGKHDKGERKHDKGDD